jgi:hypothetical protein
MFDDKEAIPQLECDRRHGEEVHGNDHFTRVLKKSQPALRGIATAAEASKITSHGPFGHPRSRVFAVHRVSWEIPTLDSPGISGESTRGVLRRFSVFQTACLSAYASTAESPPDARRPPTVSGLTITSTSFQRSQKRRNDCQNSRSKEFKGGRGRFRLRTAIRCRSTSTSSAVVARERKKTRAAASKARRNPSTN